MLPPGHVVEDAICDRVDGVNPESVYLVIVFQSRAKLLP